MSEQIPSHASSAASADRASTILVIKLSALGDVIMAMGAFRAIRDAHPEAHLVLLTSPSYRYLGEGCGCFDEVWTTQKPTWWRPWEERALARRLRAGGFARVYDLQWSSLTNRLFGALAREGLEWVGVAPGCSHHYAGRKAQLHIAERQAEMLALAGIPHPPLPDLGFLSAEIAEPLPASYALLVPGSSARHPGKRWPLESYAALCHGLLSRGIVPVLICGPEEAEIAPRLQQACPDALAWDLRIPGIAEVARGAKVAIGNDTGPLHVIAASGCPTVALFGSLSDPVKTGPLGKTRKLRRDPIAALPVEEVLEAVDELVRQDPTQAAGSTA